MIKAILFDLDGTLVDTEKIFMKVAQKIAHKHGFELNEHETFLYGVQAETFYKIILKNRRKDLDIKKLVEEHKKNYEELIKEKIKIFPGAIEAVKESKEKYKIGLVSGSDQKEIRIVLKKINIIVASKDTKKGKPDPEGYLRAARRLKVKPFECIAIEDSKAGIDAGKSAGMKVIGVLNGSKQNLSEAHKIIRDLRYLPLIVLTTKTLKTLQILNKNNGNRRRQRVRRF